MPNSTHNESISLYDLLRNVDKAIQTSLPGSHWVKAEILQVQDKGWWSIELSSYDNENKAKARAVIWKSNLEIVRNFETTTGAQLRTGLKILARVQIDYHSEYGLSLNIVELDPAFSLGDMKVRLEMIRRRLKKLDEYDNNKKRSHPKEFTNVAVISPQEAAGLGDFTSQAQLLESNSICTFKYYPALFQGPRSEESIVQAMSQVVKDHNSAPFDAVVVIRGGGDKAGLYELNKIKIARCVCRMPIPVFVGVGHDRDSTILDELANRSFATPSLVIARILSDVIDNSRRASKDYAKICNRGNELILYARNNTERDYENLLHLAARMVDRSHKEVMKSHRSLTEVPKNILQAARQQVSEMKSSVDITAVNSIQRYKQEAERSFRLLLHRATVNMSEARNCTMRFHGGVSTSPRAILSKASVELQKNNSSLHHGAASCVQSHRETVKEYFQSVCAQAERKVSSARASLVQAKTSSHISATSAIELSRRELVSTRGFLFSTSYSMSNKAERNVKSLRQQAATGGARFLPAAISDLVQKHTKMRTDGVRVLDRARLLVSNHNSVVENLNPDLVIKRGFALVLDSAGKPVVEKSALSPNDLVSITLRDGAAKAEIKND